MGAVGTTQFLETSNGSVTIYDKSNGAVTSRVSMNTFWSAVGLPDPIPNSPPGSGNFAGGGDQRVLFDHYTNRWVVIGFGDTNNKINIAVSKTADASGLWGSTQVTVLPSGTADYPTLAMDDKGVYIGTNNFTPGFTGTSLLSIPKTSLFGAIASTAGMTTFNTPLAGTDRGFAIQAALNWQGNASNTTAVIADSRDFNAQVFYKLNGVNAPGATQTASNLIAGTGYNVAGRGRQPDGTRTVDTLSPRISANAVQYNGHVFALATVRSDLGDFAAIRWTVVDSTTGALVSSGKIQSAGFDYYQGSIAINEFGEAVIGYNRSGFAKGDGNADGLDDGNISFMAQAFDVDGGGNLTLAGAEMLLKVSTVSDYHCTQTTAAACRERWGDYSAVTIDPNDHHTFYAIGEYAGDWAVIPGFTTTPRAIWHTYIAAIDLDGNGTVSEPVSLALVALAGLGMLASRRRKPV